MKENAINWDLIPKIITKDQLYKICHICKSTAQCLLRGGKIPCATARKHDAIKSKRKMLSNMKIERFSRNVILHRQVGIKRTMQ